MLDDLQMVVALHFLREKKFTKYIRILFLQGRNNNNLFRRFVGQKIKTVQAKE